MSVMAAKRRGNERQDWSDEGNDSIVEHDMQSIASAHEMTSPNARRPLVMEQINHNSLYSSIGNHGNTSISISGGHSIQVPHADSRMKPGSKGTPGIDEDGTIGGASTQYPYH